MVNSVVIMDPDNLRDQAGMERAFIQYFDDVREQCPGTLNAMLEAHFGSCNREKQTVTLWAEPKSWMANPGGILHGGIAAAYMDVTMGILCRYCSGGGYMPVSIHMDVNYLRAVPIRGRICIQAKMIRAGASICVAEASIWAEDQPERLLATAGGTYSVKGGTGKEAASVHP